MKITVKGVYNYELSGKELTMLSSPPNFKLFFRRIWFTFTHPGWHRLDRHKPTYHQPCDVVEILYGNEEYGASYEFSITPDVTYEGFVCPKGLFVSTPKNTYWRSSDIVVNHRESVANWKPGNLKKLPVGVFKWGDRDD